MRFDNKDKDPIKKLQFWTRESLYRRMVAVCPNQGDLSDLMREGLEIGISIREQKLSSFVHLEQESKAS